jgi:hypothetical protein
MVRSAPSGAVTSHCSTRFIRQVTSSVEAPEPSAVQATSATFVPARASENEYRWRYSAPALRSTSDTSVPRVEERFTSPVAYGPNDRR